MDASVTAPFDGQVTAKWADTGALAAPGTPLLTLERAGGYRVDLMVPETHVEHVREGQSVKVRVPAAGAGPIAGTVEAVVPAVDPGSRSFVVQVGITASEGLQSGMFARADLPIGEAPMMRIPATAIVRKGQLTGVFIIDNDDIARFRLIRTGRPYGDQVEVISGIKDGTHLVAAPPVQLKNGSAVELER